MEMTMKKTAIGLSLAALVLGGAASAAPPAPVAPPAKAHDAGRAITRAEAQTAAAALFARLDANKDGKLDQTDRASQVAAFKTRMFDRLDADKDGQISRAEFMADRGAVKPGPRRGGRGGAMGGTRAEDAARGPMTQAEFVAAALQRFDARDTNKDGQVTPAERRQARTRKAQD